MSIFPPFDMVSATPATSKPELDSQHVKSKLPVFTPLPYTIPQIRAAIPSEYFVLSTSRALTTLTRNILMATFFFVLALYIPSIQLSYPFQVCTPLLRAAAWAGYWWFQGHTLTGIWVLGHGCGHGAFNLYTWLNDSLRFILHTFLWPPYFSWKIGPSYPEDFEILLSESVESDTSNGVQFDPFRWRYVHCREYSEPGVFDIIRKYLLPKHSVLESGFAADYYEDLGIYHPSFRATAKIDYRIPLHHVDASRFWAVLIGIDAYRTYPLCGCVSDALTMENYLIKDLGVPKERIQRLLGPTEHGSLNNSSTPSRTNIVSYLLSLVSNPEIELGDNIIIYFSGHGSSYSPSDFGFDAKTGSIEVLCPIDRGDLDANGIPIPDISDREINAILTEISRSKGHHITVILDCCHSGSLTRNIQSRIHTIPPLPPASLKAMLDTAEEKMKSFPGYRSVLAEDWRPDMTSHVVLAACKGDQSAREEKGEDGFSGVFTQALLCTLKSNNLTNKSTFRDLIQALPHIPDQQPVVAGRHKHACLWYQ